MTLDLLYQTAKALWRVGLLRMKLRSAWNIFMAWRHCSGSFSFLAEMSALRFGKAMALIDDEGPMTFAELRQAYENSAQVLIADYGVGPGRLVVIAERNHRNFVIALLAAARSGADVLLVNPDSPPKVMDQLLSRHAIDAVLYGKEVEIGSSARTVAQIALPVKPCANRRPRCLPPLKRAGTLQILTSGSTGLAKRIKRRPTLSSLLPALLGLLQSLPIGMHQPTVLAIPLFHGHGLSTLAMTLAFAAPLHMSRRFEIAPLLQRATMPEKPIVVSVPTLLQRWANSGEGFDRVSAVITGSAPLTPQLCQRLMALLGPILYNLYGSSEAGIVSVALPEMLSQAPGTVGRPLPGNEVRLVDFEGRPAQLVGRILVRGPLVLKADADGWLDTGDLGQWDDKRHLFVCGRSDDMLISGGENIYPREVEGVLREHPFIEEAAIVVLPDAEFGQRMHACIIVRSGHTLTPADIRHWLQERVERFKVPKRFEIVSELPRNLLGKIDHQALLDVALTHLPSA